MQDADRSVAQEKGFSILQEQVKLTSIGFEMILLCVPMKDLLKKSLNLYDMFTNRRLGVGELGMQVVGSRQVVGMDMCFHNVVDLKVVHFTVEHDCLIVRQSRSGGCHVKIQDRINDHGMLRRVILDNVGTGVGSLVEDTMDLGRLICCCCCCCCHDDDDGRLMASYLLLIWECFGN
jgi:hypothetical protein